MIDLRLFSRLSLVLVATLALAPSSSFGQLLGGVVPDLNLLDNIEKTLDGIYQCTGVTTLSAPLTLDGPLKLIGAGASLQLGTHTLSVDGALDLSAGATLEGAEGSSCSASALNVLAGAAVSLNGTFAINVGGELNAKGKVVLRGSSTLVGIKANIEDQGELELHG